MTKTNTLLACLLVAGTALAAVPSAAALDDDPCVYGPDETCILPRADTLCSGLLTDAGHALDSDLSAYEGYCTPPGTGALVEACIAAGPVTTLVIWLVETVQSLVLHK